MNISNVSECVCFTMITFSCTHEAYPTRANTNTTRMSASYEFTADTGLNIRGQYICMIRLSAELVIWSVLKVYADGLYKCLNALKIRAVKLRSMEYFVSN